MAIDRAALEDLTRHAMAAGFACLAERFASGEVSRTSSLTDALADFPAEFLTIRSSLVDALTAGGR